jgi:tRNA modification GTPase
MHDLKLALVERARSAMPKPGQSALSRRQRELIGAALGALDGAEPSGDPLLLAEQLRAARLAFDRLIGRAATEDMLDALFGRFCIGK